MVNQDLSENHHVVADAIRSERQRLLGFCTRLTGDWSIAEDLTQETLTEAWRCAASLRDPNTVSAWLRGIARNVCRGYLRDVQRQRATYLSFKLEHEESFQRRTCWSSACEEVEIELERSELAALLDRAMALLPPETREVLIHRYIQESSYEQIAEQLGVSEGSAMVRLHRGKLALRHVLATDLREEAAWYGLVNAESDAWQGTRTWCPFCGQQRLIHRFSRFHGNFMVRCPDCHLGSLVNAHPGGPQWSLWFDNTFGNVTAPKALLNRAMRWGATYFQAAIASRTARCPGCGRRQPLRLNLPPHEQSVLSGDEVGVHLSCEHCGGGPISMSLTGLALFLPEGQRFWNEQRRIHRLPTIEVEADGREAFVVGYQSLSSNARFNVIWACDTYELLHIHPDPRS